MVFGKNMMDRCYKQSCSGYKTYGGKGVVVCDRWHVLNNFIQAIDLIEGFDLNKFLNGKICLDKDKLGDSKEYSLNKCCFISPEENNKYKPNQQATIIGISPKGDKFEFTNQSEFARQHNLRQPSISDCVRKRLKSHKGWTFYFK